MSNSGEKKYLTASIYYLIGNVIGQGIVLLSSSIFTRMMDKEAYGLVSTYSAWVLVFNTFIGLNLFVTVRNAYIDFKESYDKFVSSVLLLSLIAFGGFCVLIISICNIFCLDVDLFVIVLCMVQAISVHTINLAMAVYSMKNRYKPRVALMVFPNVLHTLLSIGLILLYSKNAYYAKIVGNVLGLAIFAIVIILVFFKKEKPAIDKTFWKYALTISCPGIMMTLSDLILMQSDRIMLTEMVGAEETAVYSLVYNIGSILIALYTAINGAWNPWFYKKLAEPSYPDIEKVEKIYINVFTIVTMLILLASPEAIKILSPQNYWYGIDYVNAVVFASFLIFIYAFFTMHLMYEKKPGVIAKNTVIAAGLNVLINYILIPEHKGWGAAIATAISYVVLFVLHYRAIKKQCCTCFCEKYIMRNILYMLLFCVGFYFVRNSLIMRSLVIVVLMGICLVMLKREGVLKVRGGK